MMKFEYQRIDSNITIGHSYIKVLFSLSDAMKKFKNILLKN